MAADEKDPMLVGSIRCSQQGWVSSEQVVRIADTLE